MAIPLKLRFHIFRFNLCRFGSGQRNQVGRHYRQPCVAFKRSSTLPRAAVKSEAPLYPGDDRLHSGPEASQAIVYPLTAAHILHGQPPSAGSLRTTAPMRILMNHAHYGSFPIENIADAFQFPGLRMIDSRIHQRQLFLLFSRILRRPLSLCLQQYRFFGHFRYTAKRMESPP